MTVTGESAATSLGDRWRREATRGVDEKRLLMALQALPSIRQPQLRIGRGAISAEFEGAMGSIHELSIRVPVLPQRNLDQVARVMRRSAKLLSALQEGRVPLAFDRLVSRICGESVFPESRRITFACTCGLPESPCRHLLALHELFARRLDEQPWLLLSLRGIDIRQLIEAALSPAARGDGASLPYGAAEEPLLFPQAGDGDLDSALTKEQAGSLLGLLPSSVFEACLQAIDRVAGAAHETDAGGGGSV